MAEEEMAIRCQTIIRCPVCGHQKAEDMPTDAPVCAFTHCTIYKNVIKTKAR